MAGRSRKRQLYTIKELEDLTGVTRRTIHFYVKENLLPPPAGRGPGARYSEDHRLRLLLIALLKDVTHLRLEGIREYIEPMDADDLQSEIRRLGGESGPDQDEGDALYFSAPDVEPIRLAGAPGEGEAPRRVSFADWVTRRARIASHGGEATGDTTGESDRRESPGDSWQRVRITPDLEIHYRIAGDDGRMRKIRTLITWARRLFRG